MRVVVTGAAGALGRRVVTQLHHDQQNAHLYPGRPEIELITLDKSDMHELPEPVISKQVDLETADLSELFSNADTVIYLANTIRAWTLDTAETERELALFHRTLSALTSAGVSHLVIATSAMLYGARSDNPVPITEDMPTRPNPDFEWVIQKQRLEESAQEWANGMPSTPGTVRPRSVATRSARPHSRSLTILRPTAIVAESRLGHLAWTLKATRAKIKAGGDPPVQYLHIDDLAAAIVVAVHTCYDGILNVAPDKWIPPDELADLEGPRARLRVPEPIARSISALRWRWGLAPTPPGVVSYTIYPWVVANDRLRKLGWEPTYTNEEAWVVSHEPGLWELPALRRRELLIGLIVSATLVTAAFAIWITIKIKQHHKTRS